MPTRSEVLCITFKQMVIPAILIAFICFFLIYSSFYLGLKNFIVALFFGIVISVSVFIFLILRNLKQHQNHVKSLFLKDSLVWDDWLAGTVREINYSITAYVKVHCSEEDEDWFFCRIDDETSIILASIPHTNPPVLPPKNRVTVLVIPRSNSLLSFKTEGEQIPEIAFHLWDDHLQQKVGNIMKAKWPDVVNGIAIWPY